MLGPVQSDKYMRSKRYTMFSGIMKKRQLIRSDLIATNTHFSGRSDWTARPGNFGRTNFPGVRLRCEPHAACISLTWQSVSRGRYWPT